MTDVFISYKSERRAAARHLARVLELHGYEVWFDYDLLSGSDFARQIEAKLRGAEAVVTLWCTQSVKSEWVLEEAHVAKERGVIIPTWIEKADLPFGFTRLDTIDLTPWDGGPRSHSLDRLFEQVAAQTGKQPAPNYAGLKTYEEDWRGFGAPSLAKFGLSQAAPREEPEKPKAQTPGITVSKPDYDGVFSDIFGSFIREQPKNLNYNAEIEISLEDAVAGRVAKVTIPQGETCATCGGTGAKAGSATKTCGTCNGVGRVRATQGFFTLEQTCPDCRGRGFIAEDPCPDCKGVGFLGEERTVSFKIPPGVDTGAVLRLVGHGLSDAKSGKKGDALVRIKVLEHEVFKRDGENLTIHLTLDDKTYYEGGSVDIESIEGGRLRIKIPKQSKTTGLLRLKGQGVPKKGAKDRGDLFVTLKPQSQTT